MRKFFSVAVQFVAYLLTFLVGSFWRPFRLQTVLEADVIRTRIFVWDGLVLMLVVFALVLVVEVVRKKIRVAGVWSTIAVVLAGAAGLAMKFGFISADR